MRDEEQAGPRGYVGFAGSTLVASGSLLEVALEARRRAVSGSPRTVRIFDDSTGSPVDVDLRGSPEDLAARLAPRDEDPEAGETEPRGRGRPRLGVVSKEVTLLPRHWAWLSAQRGSVSATLRRLIDDARREHEARDVVRRAQDSAYRFMSAMAGHDPNFEEAIRALYRGDRARFEKETEGWPPDVRAHTRKLASDAFHRGSDDEPSDEGE